LAETNEERIARGSENCPKKRYERPEVAWEEEYKPTAFGVSCAKLPGALGCVPGPAHN
jgi:hypothetical protein